MDWMNWATWSSLGVLFLLVTNLIVIHHDDKDKEDNIIFDVKGNHGHNIMPGVCQNKLKQKVKLSLVSLQIVENQCSQANPDKGRENQIQIKTDIQKIAVATEGGELFK